EQHQDGLSVDVYQDDFFVGVLVADAAQERETLEAIKVLTLPINEGLGYACLRTTGVSSVENDGVCTVVSTQLCLNVDLLSDAGSLAGRADIAKALLILRYGSPSLAVGALVVDHSRPMGSDTSHLQSLQIGLTLHPFQIRTVDWMLEREGVCIDRSNQISSVPIPPVSVLVPLMDDLSVDIRSGRMGYGITADAPVVRGGVLADEMGMGKTLMILSTILLHPFDASQIRDNHQNLQPGKTTLIITPAAILSQWMQETHKNTSGISTFYFDGRQETKRGVWIDENYLKKYDVVFTTYQVLQKEIHAARAGREGLRRFGRPVERRSSPLVKLYFWRV
ncbi:hypothetical protein HDU91_004253, partial [Kappamyces sp. JEL0680]